MKIIIIGSGIAALSIGFELINKNVEVVFVSPKNSSNAMLAAVGLSTLKGKTHFNDSFQLLKKKGHEHLLHWVRAISTASKVDINTLENKVIEPFWDEKDYFALRSRVFHREFTGLYNFKRLKTVPYPFSPTPIGAFYYPDDVWVDPRALMQALKFVNIKYHRFINAKVTNISLDSSNKNAFSLHLESKNSQKSEISADFVVIAAGDSSPSLISQYFKNKLIQNKFKRYFGQTLSLKMSKNIDNYCIVKNAASFCSFNNHILLGSSKFQDKLLEKKNLHKLYTDALSFGIEKEQLKSADLLSGIRLMSFDRLPLLGRLSYNENYAKNNGLFVSTSFYKSGLQLASLFAQEICAQMLKCTKTRRNNLFHGLFFDRFS